MRLINLFLTSFLVVFFFISLLSVQTQAQLFGGPPGFHTDPDHIPKNPYIREYIRVSECNILTKEKTYRLSEAGGNYQQAYEILNLTPSGRKILREFNQLATQYKHEYIELNQYTRQSHGFPLQVGAAYAFNDKGRFIFYDPQESLGLLPIMFAHELTHAIDPQVPVAYFQEKEARQKLSQEDYSKIAYRNSFDVERKAFSAQDKVVPELMQLAPCYARFIKEQIERAGFTMEVPTSNELIIRAYGLPADFKP
jgi:hypothetical protein